MRKRTTGPAVAGVGWRDNSDAFVVMGRGGNPSFLFRSTNGGADWTDITPTAAAAKFQVKGNNYSGGGSKSHPRGTGRLIGFGTSSGSLIYVAGMDALVRMNDATGPSSGVKVEDWPGTGEAVSLAVTPGAESGGPPGDTAWGLLRDPGGSDPWTSTGSGNGVVKLTNAQGGGTASGLLSPSCLPDTARAAELVAVSEGGVTALYVAWGRMGIFRFKSGSWSTTARTSATPGACTGGANLGPVADVEGWTAIDAVRLGTTTTLVVGGIAGGCGSSPCPVIQRVTVPGSGAPFATELVSAPGDVQAGMIGDLSRDWWHVVRFVDDPPSIAGTDAKMGGASWVTSMVDILPTTSANSLTMLVSGCGGIWRGTFDNGDRNWNPAVRGMANTYSKGAAIDPATPAHAVSMDGNCNFTGRRTGSRPLCHTTTSQRRVDTPTTPRVRRLPQTGVSSTGTPRATSGSIPTRMPRPPHRTVG